MKAATREWIKKAESDYQLAVSLMRRRKPPVRDQACFLFQQASEKYLKARLEEAGMSVPKTHDLEMLVQLLIPVEPLWTALTSSAQQLTRYAVRFRYPGHEATASEMKTAQKDAKAIRHEARLALGV
jgi:HEPN domain-containing protein